MSRQSPTPTAGGESPESDDDETAATNDPVLRFVRPVLAALLTFGSLAWSADLYRDVGLVLFPEQFLAGMLGVALALVFLHYPARRKTERIRVPSYDLGAACLGLLAGGYVAAVFPDLSERMSFQPVDGLIVSIILVALCLEGLRRTVGYSLVVIVGIGLIYALVGHLVPGALETRKVDPSAFVIYLALDTSALLGLAMVVGTTVVITFVFFGQLLMRSGGSQFFNDISLVLMGRYRGGSAKISIIASSLFGSVSGVAVSNIVATGVVTIPLMKRSGFSPRFAGAVEAVASTGGQLMPPVMGAVAFLMADFLEKPYQDIVIAALVPSLLYYVGLFIQADLEAAKGGIRRLPENEIPRTRSVLATGWVFLMPFVALIWALFTLNWEPETAAMLACLTILLIALFLIMVGHVQTRDGTEFPVTAGTWTAAALIALPLVTVIWIAFAAGILTLFMALALTGSALISAFFLGGLVRLAILRGGAENSTVTVLKDFGAYLLRTLSKGALPSGLPLLLVVWAMKSAGWIGTGFAIFLTACSIILMLTQGSLRAQAAAGEAKKTADRASGTFLAGIWGTIDLIAKSLVRTGLSSLDILMIVAGAGFIIGTLQITGLGFALTTMLVKTGGGSLLVLLLIAAVLCIVLGMGMPTAGVYILLAVLIAPSLVEVGIMPIAAHMFILYLGMMSLITPPVAVAAFFAANIARSPPMMTGWTSVRFGWTAFVVPFLFVFSPSLLLQGSTPDVVIDVATAVAGVWLASAAMIGYFVRPMSATTRAVFALAGIALLLPRGINADLIWVNAAGLVVGLCIIVVEFRNSKRG